MTMSNNSRSSMSDWIAFSFPGSLIPSNHHPSLLLYRFKEKALQALHDVLDFEVLHCLLSASI